MTTDGRRGRAAADTPDEWGRPTEHRRRDRVGLLSATTRGDMARSRRWRETLESYGTGDELRVVAADERGCWARFDL